MTYEPIWNSIIAWYLFLAGLGGGAFVASTFIRRFHPKATHLRRAGHIIAPVTVIIGLLLLMVDAKAGFSNPLRFALLLTNFGSVMTWGVVFLSGFTVVALVVAVLDFVKKPVPWALDIAGSVLGVCVAVYTGCLLGVCNGFPLWNNALLPILFLVSAMSTGIASVMVAGLIRWPGEFHEAGLLKRVHFGIGVVEIALVAALLFVTSFNSVAGLTSVQHLVAGPYAVAFWIGFVAIGLVGPLAVELWLLFIAEPKTEESSAGRWCALASETGVLIGGFLLRLLVLIAAVPVTMMVPYL